MAYVPGSCLVELSKAKGVSYGALLTRTRAFRGGDDRHRLELTASCLAEGLVLTLVGGESSHVGAVALSEPRPSHRNKDVLSSTTSVLTRLGHKEDELAKSLAARVAKALGVPVVLVAGIHLDRATDSDIRKFVESSEELVARSLPSIREMFEKMSSEP